MATRNRGRLLQAELRDIGDVDAESPSQGDVLARTSSDTWQAQAPGVTPTGGLIAYGAATAPTGWLLCDGAAVSRTTYADLFAIISTTYGTGDGSTTFNVPDARQSFLLGKAASGTGANLGDTGGAIDHVHSVDVPSHDHPLNNPMTRAAGGSAAVIATATGATDIAAFDSDSDNPPFITVNWIIKT